MKVPNLERQCLRLFGHRLNVCESDARRVGSHKQAENKKTDVFAREQIHRLRVAGASTDTLHNNSAPRSGEIHVFAASGYVLGLQKILE